MSGRFPLAGIVVVLAGVLAGSALADTIKLKDGTDKAKVTIVKETYKQVQYKIRGLAATQSFPMEKVEEVIYSRPPQDYKDARNYMRDGDYETAFSLFMSVAVSDKSRDQQFRQYAYFNAAECQRFMGEFNEAIKVFNDLMTEIPDTKFYGEASLKKADCYRSQGKADMALRVALKLQKDVEDKDLGEEWKYAAELARLEMSTNVRASEALRQLMDLHRQTEKKYPHVANKARLAIGSVYIKQKQFDEARNFFQEIIDNRIGTPEETVAGAYNGLGETLVSSSDDREDQEQALYHFLRVIYHYQNVRVEHPKAMFYAGKIFKIRGERGRARNLLNRCSREFPGTEWAELAKAEM